MTLNSKVVSQNEDLNDLKGESGDLNPPSSMGIKDKKRSLQVGLTSESDEDGKLNSQGDHDEDLSAEHIPL